ncbi:hypothetical protein K1719_047473 [Acacia pycnantha]|nr:hypothetical protein K1719_047473 [Acacia pycnantha]
MGACAVVLPEGIDGRSDPLCAWISQTCLPLRWNDPKVSGISIPIVGAHVQPPSISRLAVLDRRLPCFHLLAAQGARGVWMPRRRREGRNAWACEWCLDRPCRLAPCPSTERSAGDPRRSREVAWFPIGRFLCCLPLQGKSSRLDVSLHPAPSKGRGRTAEHPPRSSEPPRSRGPRGRAMLSDPANAVGEDSRPGPKRSSDVVHDVRSRPPTAPAARGRGAASPRNATWLILPVVICLSQRLSHACGSIPEREPEKRLPHPRKAAARKLPNPDTGSWTLGWVDRSASGVHRSARPFCRRCAPGLNWPGRASGAVTLKKLECSKQAYALDTLAWDNIIGFRSYCVGLRDRSND